MKKTHWSDDPRLRADAELQDARRSMRVEVEDRNPWLDARLAAEMERLFIRSGVFTLKELGFLVTTLEQTDKRKHTCFRHRRYLTREAGVSERWARMLVTRCEWWMPLAIVTGDGAKRPQFRAAGVLERIDYNRFHKDLIPGTTEWGEGCHLLRWPVVDLEALEAHLRRMLREQNSRAPQASTLHRAAVQIPPGEAVAIPPSAAVHSPPGEDPHSPPRAAVEIPSREDLHSPPSICAFLKSEPSVKPPPHPSPQRVAPEQEAAATSGQDSREVSETRIHVASPESDAVVTSHPLQPSSATTRPSPENGEAGEGGRAKSVPSPTPATTSPAWSREELRAAYRWFEYRRRIMFPQSKPYTPTPIEREPVAAALRHFATELDGDLDRALHDMLWTIWGTHRKYREHDNRNDWFAVRVLVRPGVMTAALDYARNDIGRDVELAAPGSEDANEPPARPEVAQAPREAVSKPVGDRVVTAQKLSPAEIARRIEDTRRLEEEP